MLPYVTYEAKLLTISAEYINYFFTTQFHTWSDFLLSSATVAGPDFGRVMPWPPADDDDPTANSSSTRSKSTEHAAAESAFNCRCTCAHTQPLPTARTRLSGILCHCRRRSLVRGVLPQTEVDWDDDDGGPYWCPGGSNGGGGIRHGTTPVSYTHLTLPTNREV